MTTISNSTPGIYGYSPSLTRSGNAAGTASSAVVATSGSSSDFTASSVSDAPLTYNAAGQLQPAIGNKPTTSITPEGARSAYLDAENAVTQALESLTTGSASNTSTSDIFGAGSTSKANDLFGLAGNASVNPAASPVADVNAKAQVAQKAYMATQNMVTQSLNSLIK
jgi:hypothetical protein